MHHVKPAFSSGEFRCFGLNATVLQHGPCIFPPTEILTVTRYKLRNTACAESKFRNSDPISKNRMFWILDDDDRISEITDLLSEMLKF